MVDGENDLALNMKTKLKSWSDKRSLFLKCYFHSHDIAPKWCLAIMAFEEKMKKFAWTLLASTERIFTVLAKKTELAIHREESLKWFLSKLC